jgi:hypothetical protein
VQLNNTIKKKKLSSKNRVYFIHDNGGRPFKVIANKSGIHIYTHQDIDYSKLGENGEPELKYDILVKKITKFTGYWYGFDTSQFSTYHGNSILIQITKKQYIEVGYEIYSFETSEEIIDYISPVGNSDVPYPVAYSENYVYFMLDKKYVPKKQLMIQATPINAEDIYSEYYGHINPENNKKMRKIKFKKVKTIAKRKY